MVAKYFNKLEFNKALSLVKTNPLEAKLKYEEYLNKYPKDYSAYPYYASTLITLGEFSEAEKILDFAKSLASRDQNFVKDKNKFNIFNTNISFSKLRLLSYQEKFDELYKFYFNHLHEVRNTDINNIEFYFKRKMGRLKHYSRDNHSYLFRQIIEYDENDFLEHCKRHMADYNLDTDTVNKNLFGSGFPINDVINEIKKYMLSDKRLYPGFFEDVYIFKYDECGRDNNKLVDYFKVVCFHDTCNFITMLPVNEAENLPYIDLNYLNSKKENKNTKVKRVSQIDKFNQRYGRN